MHLKKKQTQGAQVSFYCSYSCHTHEKASITTSYYLLK